MKDYSQGELLFLSETVINVQKKLNQWRHDYFIEIIHFSIESRPQSLFAHCFIHRIRMDQGGN